MSAALLFLLAWLFAMVVAAGVFIGLDLWVAYRRETVRATRETRT